jgi:hypothetical protein
LFTRKMGPWPQWQLTKSKSQLFWGKGNNVFYSSNDEKDGKLTSQILVISLLRENICFTKVISRAHFLICYKTHIPECVLGVFRCLVPHFWSCKSLLPGLVLWWSKRDKE